MTSMSHNAVRRILATVAILVTLIAGLAVALQPGSADAAQATGHRTVAVTLRLHGCVACDVMVGAAYGANGSHYWHSPLKRSHHGTVTFMVPRARTRGLTISIDPRWERRDRIPTGYETLAVMRYRGIVPGAKVTTAVAQHKHYGSACWAGTRASTATMNVQVRKVRVEGTTGRTNGTLAWVSPQVRQIGAMGRVSRGIYGTQAVPDCTR